MVTFSLDSDNRSLEAANGRRPPGRSGQTAAIAQGHGTCVTYALYSRAPTTQLAPVTIMAGAHVVSSALLLPLALATVGAGRAAVFTNVTPFLVIGLSWAILGEPIRWYHAVGATVVIPGVVLTTRR